MRNNSRKVFSFLIILECFLVLAVLVVPSFSNADVPLSKNDSDEFTTEPDFEPAPVPEPAPAQPPDPPPAPKPVSKPVVRNLSTLEQATDDLVRDLVVKGYTSYRFDDKNRLELVNEPIEAEASMDQDNEYAPSRDFARLKTHANSHRNRPSDKIISRVQYGTNKLGDGDALYRVAISDGRLTIEEATAIAEANSTELRGVKRRIDVARSKVREATRALLPTVSFVMEWNGGIASQRFYKGKSRKLNVNQPVFYGGELIYTLRQSEAGWKGAQQEYASARGEIVRAVANQYFSVVKAEYNLHYQTALNRDADVVYRRVRKERIKSVVSEIDYLNVESQHHSVALQFEAAKNEYVTSTLALYQSMGLPLDDRLPVDLRINFNKIDPDLDEVLTIAMRNNPTILNKQYSLEGAEWNIKIYKAKGLPHFDLRGSIGYLGEVNKDTKAIEGDNHDLDLEKEWFLGGTVSMPLGESSVEYDQIKHNYGPTVLALTGSQDFKHKVTYNLLDKIANTTDSVKAEADYYQALSELEKAANDAILGVKDELYNMRKSLVLVDSSIAKIRYQERQNSVLNYLLSMQETSPSNVMEGFIEQAQNKFGLIEAVTDYHKAVLTLNVLMGDGKHFESRS